MCCIAPPKIMKEEFFLVWESPIECEAENICERMHSIFNWEKKWFSLKHSRADCGKWVIFGPQFSSRDNDASVDRFRNAYCFKHVLEYVQGSALFRHDPFKSYLNFDAMSTISTSFSCICFGTTAWDESEIQVRITFRECHNLLLNASVKGAFPTVEDLEWNRFANDFMLHAS